jgi:hypothetical protein
MGRCRMTGCWPDYLNYAFAYSAWLGLDKNRFPIEAAHRSAELWMLTALFVPAIGVLLIGRSFRGSHWFLPIYFVPASFVPTLLVIAVLVRRT